MHPGEQPLHHGLIQGFGHKTAQGLVHLMAKGLLAEVMAGHADDPGLGMEQAGPVELIKRWDQLAPRQISQHTKNRKITRLTHNFPLASARGRR